MYFLWIFSPAALRAASTISMFFAGGASRRLNIFGFFLPAAFRAASKIQIFRLNDSESQPADSNGGMISLLVN